MSLSIPVHNAQVSPAEPTQNPTLVQPVLSLEVEQLAADGETPQQIASSLSTPVYDVDTVLGRDGLSSGALAGLANHPRLSLQA